MELQPGSVTTRVSVLLCMTDLAHASKLKEHDDNDDFQGTTGRTATLTLTMRPSVKPLSEWH